MPTHNLRLHIIPTPESFQILDFWIGGSGKILPDDLETITLLETLRQDQGVVISGRGPVWLHAFLASQIQGVPWIAVHGVGDRGAVVVRGLLAKEYHPGKLIPLEQFQPYLPAHKTVRTPDLDTATRPMVVAFLGPPHSGKSVLLNAITKVLAEKVSGESWQRRMYLFRACPDGEGTWFSEIPSEQGMVLRYKNDFNNEFVQIICNNLDSIKQQKDLILVDCGGIIDKKNQPIMTRCSHAIIISSDTGMIPEWRGAAYLCGLEILAEVESVRIPESKVLSYSPLRVRIGPLERNATLPPIPDDLLKDMTKVLS